MSHDIPLSSLRYTYHMILRTISIRAYSQKIWDQNFLKFSGEMEAYNLSSIVSEYSTWSR